MLGIVFLIIGIIAIICSIVYFGIKNDTVEVDPKIPIFKDDCDYDEYWGIKHNYNEIIKK